MNRLMKPGTDLGTILIHWIFFATLCVSVASGLRIAADSPNLAWLRALDGVLLQQFVWQTHLIAAVTLCSIAVAYLVYLQRSGLVSRIYINKQDFFALFSRNYHKRRVVNIALYWIFFLILLVQLSTGVLLYVGFGGVYVTIHLIGTWLLIAYPVLHVAAQLWLGGLKQILRIFRPIRLLPPPRPFDPADVISVLLLNSQSALHQSQEQATVQQARLRTNTKGTTLNTHPLTVAAIAGLFSTITLVTIDKKAPDTLNVKLIQTSGMPKIDGDLSDPTWRSADRIFVRTHQGANFGGAGVSEIEIYAVHDGTNAFFAFSWTDPTRSLKHLPLIRNDKGWYLLNEEYSIEDEDTYYEDKFAVMFSKDSAFGADNSIHLGQAPLQGKPAALSGRGLHYTNDGTILDVWHWKAARGGLLGWVDDNYFGPPAEPAPNEIAGSSRYKGGYRADPGKASYSNNFKQQPPGGYRTPLEPVRLPKDLSATLAAMGRVDLHPDQSEEDGAAWWMTEAASAPFTPDLDAQIPVGTVIPGVIISGTYSGDRADVRGAARWAAGRWTLEVSRRLDTSSKFDVPIESNTFLWVSAFDHSQTRHTRHPRPVRLELEQ